MQISKRLNEHTHTLTDIMNKLKTAEDEKASLLTVIHLLPIREQ